MARKSRYTSGSAEALNLLFLNLQVTDYLHIDFETRSALDLKEVGLANYAAHESTGIWIMCYAFNDEPVQRWYPKDPIPHRVWSYIFGGWPVIAHNFSFERRIWNLKIWAPSTHDLGGFLPLSQGICTMAMAYAMGLPGSLEQASAAMGIDKQKDMAGRRLMLQMSRPRSQNKDGSYVWWDEPDKIERLSQYCETDVEVERELFKRLLRLSPKEQKVWQLDFEINQRGIQIDIASVKKAIELVEVEKEKLEVQIQEASNGAISGVNSAMQIKNFLADNCIFTDSIAKESLNSLLLTNPAPHVKKVLQLRQMGSKTSTAKLNSMIAKSSSDGRIRNTLQYCGANTGRWAARGIQIHNFPRGSFDEMETDDIIQAIKNGSSAWIELFHGPVLSVISDVLRSFITAKDGHTLIWADFDQIEARIVAWLAGEEFVLDIFRRGGKLYEEEASRIYRCLLSQVTPEMRRIGKTATLALGFAGGVGAFQAMARNLGFHIPDEEAERIKVAWREAHPKTCQFWRDLERAAICATKNRGDQYSVGAIKYRTKGSFLFCKLPSDRVITYPYPKIEMKRTPWGEMKEHLTYMALDTNNKWVRTGTYGGSLCENVTQAVARDILVEAMIRVDQTGLSIVFHVHDEVVCEVLDLDGLQDMRDWVGRIVSEVPSWAKGLPIGATVQSGKRYRK